MLALESSPPSQKGRQAPNRKQVEVADSFRSTEPRGILNEQKVVQHLLEPILRANAIYSNVIEPILTPPAEQEMARARPIIDSKYQERKEELQNRIREANKAYARGYRRNGSLFDSLAGKTPALSTEDQTHNKDLSAAYEQAKKDFIEDMVQAEKDRLDEMARAYIGGLQKNILFLQNTQDKLSPYDIEIPEFNEWVASIEGSINQIKTATAQLKEEVEPHTRPDLKFHEPGPPDGELMYRLESRLREIATNRSSDCLWNESYERRILEAFSEKAFGALCEVIPSLKIGPFGDPTLKIDAYNIRSSIDTMNRSAFAGSANAAHAPGTTVEQRRERAALERVLFLYGQVADGLGDLESFRGHRPHRIGTLRKTGKYLQELTARLIAVSPNWEDRIQETLFPTVLGKQGSKEAAIDALRCIAGYHFQALYPDKNAFLPEKEVYSDGEVAAARNIRSRALSFLKCFIREGGDSESPLREKAVDALFSFDCDSIPVLKALERIRKITKTEVVEALTKLSHYSRIKGFNQNTSDPRVQSAKDMMLGYSLELLETVENSSDRYHLLNVIHVAARKDDEGKIADPSLKQRVRDCLERKEGRNAWRVNRLLENLGIEVFPKPY